MTSAGSPRSPFTAERTDRIVLRICIFLSGGTLMALEILGFRVIDRTFGSALRETSVVIAVFLGAMSAGYFAGGRIADRRPRARTMAVALAAAALGICAVPWLDATLSERVFTSGLPLGAHSAIVTTTLFLIPTIALATVYPIGVRLFSVQSEHSGSVAGVTSAISTAGSIAGSIITAFFLIDLFRSVDRTLYFLALLTLLLSLLSLLVDLRQSRESDSFEWLRRRGVIVTMVVAIGIGANLIILGLARTPDVLGHERGSPEYGHRVLFRQDSTYHRVVVREIDRVRSLYFGRTHQTRLDLDRPLHSGLEYTHQFHLPMMLDPNIRRVLFIGVGGGTGPREFLDAYPRIEIDAVELDPLVVDVAERFFDVKKGPRLNLITADGRAFVRRSSQTWDLIVIDAYTTNRYGATIPAHLTTREFFAECARHLSPEGMLYFHCAAPHEAMITRAISKTLYQVFPTQIIVGRTDMIASASEHRLTREEMEQRVGALAADDPLKAILRKCIDQLRTERLELHGVPLMTDDYAPVDTLIRRDGGI